MRDAAQIEVDPARVTRMPGYAAANLVAAAANSNCTPDEVHGGWAARRGFYPP